MKVRDIVNEMRANTSPLSKRLTHDVGDLYGVIKQIASGDISRYLKRIDPTQVKASQSWLDDFGGGDPVFHDVPEEFWEYPIIADLGDEMVIIDGHHRIDRGSDQALVFPVQLAENTEIQKPHPDDTLGVERKHMPQVHRDHYPELIKYLEDHGNKFSHGEMHAKELRATQKEFSDKGVRKMMKTGGRPSDSAGKASKPLIVSSDNYILDGHHRWLAAWNQDDVVPVMKGTLPIKKLFQLVNDFEHTTYKDIHEEVSSNEKEVGRRRHPSNRRANERRSNG